MIRNQGYNGSNESNNFGSVSRRSTLQNGNDGGYLFQRQDGNNHPKNDYRMSQSQYLSKKDPRNSFYSETSNKEYYSPAPESNFNTFSQNQTHHQSQNTIQFNKSSVPIRSKNPYLDPNDDDIIMHKNTNFSNEKMTPETEKIISKSSEKFSSNIISSK